MWVIVSTSSNASTINQVLVPKSDNNNNNNNNNNNIYIYIYIYNVQCVYK